MSSELEQLLRNHADRLDAEMSPITAHEAIDRSEALTTSTPLLTRNSQRWGRRLSVAAGLALVVGAGVVLAQLDGDDPRIVIPAATDNPTTEPSATVEAHATPTTLETSTTATSTTATSTTVAEPEITAEQVQLAQRDALRNLTGFSATASFTNTGVDADLGESDPARYTLLTDGSLYVETGAGTFGSFDPATGIVLGAFRDQSGNMQYQEITGQSDNGLPLTILGGFDPTRLIEGTFDGEQTIRDVGFEGRPAWEVTTVQAFPADWFNVPAVSAPLDADIIQTTVQIVDQQSGLIVSTTETSTDPNSGGRDTVLSDIAVVDTMPPEFPGAFPDGAQVDRSGGSPPVTDATIDDVLDLFGIPVPIPVGLVAGTAVDGGTPEIVIVDRPQYDETDDPNSEPRTTYREARFTVREGFVATTVSVSSIVLRDGADVPTGLAVSDGYLCFDPDGDGTCESGGDPQRSTDGSGLVPIASGALADRTAELSPPDSALISASTYHGPFAITIYRSDRATADAILGSFEVLSPPT